MIPNPSIRFAFFGTPDRAVIALDALKARGLSPALIITQPDRPQGRKLVMTAPAVKVWAQEKGIPFIQPTDLSDASFLKTLKDGDFDMFVVVAYGKILKSELLNIPKHGSINLHASLLPALRGSCPIETAILQDLKATGSTIIKMDEKMDHGPILAQRAIAESKIPQWPLPADDLAAILVNDGGDLLADAIIGLANGTIKPVEQDHSKATYTKMIEKEDGRIDLSADPYKNFLKYNAYKGWPGSFFFTDKNVRVNITDAAYENGEFVIKKVIPEGKKEISWKEFEKQA
ncbi:MAG TPA: methionyl-tRNA formyltransferase [Candidatus Paceibacterota bacterium]